MPTRPTALCRCGQRSLPSSPRCRIHEAQHQAARNARRTHYDGDWDAISKAIRTEWLDTVGPWCPGFDRPGHSVAPADLTVDHVTPGSLDGGLAVLCRSCNSSKGGRHAPNA